MLAGNLCGECCDSFGEENQDPSKSRFGRPRIHGIRGYGLLVLASRLLNFFGVNRGPSAIGMGLLIFLVRPSASFFFIRRDVIGGSFRSFFSRAILDLRMNS